MNELFNQLPKGRRNRINKQVKREIQEYKSLKAFRKDLGLTQTDVANIQGVKQVNISNLENRVDMHLSTLKKYVQALGCEVEIIIKAPNNTPVRINNLFHIEH